MVESPPASSGDTDSIPGLETKIHMLQGNQACEPQLLQPVCSVTREDTTVRSPSIARKSGLRSLQRPSTAKRKTPRLRRVKERERSQRKRNKFAPLPVPMLPFPCLAPNPTTPPTGSSSPTPKLCVLSCPEAPLCTLSGIASLIHHQLTALSLK